MSIDPKDLLAFAAAAGASFPGESYLLTRRLNRDGNSGLDLDHDDDDVDDDNDFDPHVVSEDIRARIPIGASIYGTVFPTFAGIFWKGKLSHDLVTERKYSEIS